MKSGFVENSLAQWRRLQARERRWVMAALVVVLGATLWWLGVAPAWQTLRDSARQQQALDEQWQTMQQLQQQAQQWRDLPRLERAQVLRVLENSVQSQLGKTARMVVQGERVSVSWQQVRAEVLSNWLVQVRLDARVLPEQMRLNRSSSSVPVAPLSSVVWDGSIVFPLPVPTSN